MRPRERGRGAWARAGTISWPVATGGSMRSSPRAPRVVFPRIEGCVICLKSQPQADGLLDIEGMFGLAPNVTIEMDRLGIPMTQLEFVFFLGSGEGTFDMALRVVDSGGAVLTTIEIGEVEFTPAPHG